MFDVTSQAISQLSSLHNVLLIGRGGAERLTATVATDAIFDQAVNITSIVGGATDETSFISPEAKSVFFMAIAMACHYLGYSLARPITVSLFTSSQTGFKSPAAFPFAMAFVSPVALLMLMGYTNILERSGPKGALIQSTLFCAVIVNLAASAILICLQRGAMVAGIPAVKLITGPLFVFRESYVQLLTSQYWSFMASALNPKQAARWFGPIAGLTSITSAIAGLAVSPLVKRIGLTGTLMGTGMMLLLSLAASSVAYNIATKHGFEPKDRSKATKMSTKKEETGMIQKATSLFSRVPVLKALFFEILGSQGLATVLNICFMDRLGTAITDDDKRAGWVGKYYSLINLITMVLQFGVLPPLMTMIEPRDMWRVLPLVSLATTGYQAFQKDPSLYTVSASLLVMKVSEYSARRMLDEMIFVPLDFESRFVGKEVIGVFGYRFGKSLMSLLLSVLTALDGNLSLQKQSFFAYMVCFVWMKTAWDLSNMVPSREEAETAHLKEKRRSSR